MSHADPHIFGCVKSFGSSRGLDGIGLEYAQTDADRAANVHAIISGTRLALRGYHRTLDEREAPLHDWALRALYALAGSITCEDDRYAAMLTRHQLRLCG